MGMKIHDAIISGALVYNGVRLASVAEINNPTLVAERQVAAGSALSVTQAAHDGKTILLGELTGSTATLPAATGSGARFRFLVSAAATSNAHVVQVAPSADEFAGHVLQTDTDTGDALASYPALAADNFDTLTLNGTTTGGLPGDVIEVEDIASGVWALRAVTNASGVVATPLSAAVTP